MKPEFTKSELLKDAVVDFDDFAGEYDHNGLQYLFWIKSKFPKFKCTLFAIPFFGCKSQRNFLELIKRDLKWVHLAIHGEKHLHPREAKHWNRKKIEQVLNECENWGVFEKIFKAPGWQISDQTYQVLKEKEYIVADQHYNKERRPEGLKVYCTCHPWMVHGHIQDIKNRNPLYRNGLRQFIEEHGLPFDHTTVFHFIKDVL
jgi:hypothetical protein